MTSREFRARLLKRAGSAAPLISADVLELLEKYYRLLARWNSKVNLTGVRLDTLADEAMDRLFIEPLLAARYIAETAIDWVDLGSGGGSPALPLKIVRQKARLTMVEVRARKAAFLREAVRTLGLSEAAVENASFGDVAVWPNSRESADLVTVRAVKLERQVFDAAAALLRPGGRLFLFRSDVPAESRMDARFLLERVVRLADGAGSRSLLAILVRADNPTPRRTFHVEQRR